MFFWVVWLVVSTAERYVGSLHIQRGRHTDLNPMLCMRCGWTGPVRWLVHGYHSYYAGSFGDDDNYDTEPIDECPRCGQEL